MRSRNIAIVILILIGIIALFTMEFGVKPSLQQKYKQNQTVQLNPLTNDFNNILKFKSPYMGNASNDSNLNTNLPLGNIPRTYTINSTKRELDIHYKQSVREIGQKDFKSSLVYDATANFALIDNLQLITFDFQGTPYHVTRQQIQTWYSVAPVKLVTPLVWHDKVQSKLANKQYVNGAFNAFFNVGR